MSGPGASAGSEAAHRAFVTHLFEHMVNQPAGAYGKDTIENLRRSFAKSGFNIQKLLVEIACVAAMHQNQDADS